MTPTPVTETVTQLLSVPRLGLEHAAYRVETGDGAIWIDCPSAFNWDLEPVSAIYFTHKDFMGASNQYRDLWNAEICLHAQDAKLAIVKTFPVDRKFTEDFSERGLEAFHIGGHSPGFTVYVFGDVLFVCDYAFPPGPEMTTIRQSERSATGPLSRRRRAVRNAACRRDPEGAGSRRSRCPPWCGGP